MTRATTDDIRGIEFDWLGSDACGHIALFSTAGGGFAPKKFLADIRAHDAAIDAILMLPKSATIRFAPDLAPGLPNTWRAMAERGVFAYDSDIHGGPYRLVAVPTSAAHISELPSIAGAAATQIVFKQLCFATQLEITAEALALKG